MDLGYMDIGRITRTCFLTKTPFRSTQLAIPGMRFHERVCGQSRSVKPAQRVQLDERQVSSRVEDDLISFQRIAKADPFLPILAGVEYKCHWHRNH